MGASYIQKDFVLDNKIIVEGAIKESLVRCKNRLLVTIAFYVVGGLLITGRLFELSTFDVERINEITIPQLATFETARQDIVDRNGVPLSTNLKTTSLYANPQKIIDAEEAARKLSRFYPNLGYEELLGELSSKKQFIWIKRNLPPKEFEAVNDMGIPGLYFKEEEKRVYPHYNLLSHLLGFVGTDGKGLSGIEKYYDNQLSQRLEDHRPLQLSIDVRVQDTLYTELKKAKEKFSAIGAAGIIIDANNGEVLAITSMPDFDPNMPANVKPEDTFNRATYGLYEMGSVFKTYTLAAALDSKAISMNDIFDATKPLRFAGHTISDYHPENRWLTVPEVFMHSSNIGMARITKELGEDSQKKFLGKLGLLDEEDIEMSEKGKPMYPDRWGMIHAMTISYGHGMAVTPLHVATALTPLVNGGVLYKPTFLKQEGKVYGDVVVKKDTSDMIRKLLRKVVDEGTGSMAAAKGYLVGGKTGTAEKLVDGKYDRKSRLSSFLGAFPMHDPKYVIFVMLDEPKGTKDTFGIATGGFTAAPVVSKVISKIAPVLGIMPVDEESPEIKRALKIEGSGGRKDLASN